MNSKLEQNRLLFAIARKKRELELTREDVIVNGNPNTGSRCQNAREEFSYLRSEAIVETNNKLLNENKTITPSLLKKSIKKVIEERAKENESTLSA